MTVLAPGEGFSQSALCSWGYDPRQGGQVTVTDNLRRHRRPFDDRHETAEARRAHGLVWVGVVASLASLLVRAPEARALELETDAHPSFEATEPMASRAGVESWLKFSSGDIETQGTGQSQNDKVFQAGTRLRAQVSAKGRFSLRGSLSPRYAYRSRVDEPDTSRSLAGTRAELGASLDAAFVASDGIEALLGVHYGMLAKSSETIELGSVESKKTYAAGQVWAPRFGVLKRSGPFAAGLTYGLSGEEKRKVTRSLPGENNETTEETLFLPSVIAGFARFEIGGGLSSRLELALIGAGDSSEKSEDGVRMYRDYYRLSMGVVWPLGAGGLALDALLTHRTLSYGDQALMTLETIPQTSLETLLRGFQVMGLPLAAGVVLGIGQDTQSLTQLNAKMSMKSIALKVATHLPM